MFWIFFKWFLAIFLDLFVLFLFSFFHIFLKCREWKKTN